MAFVHWEHSRVWFAMLMAVKTVVTSTCYVAIDTSVTQIATQVWWGYFDLWLGNTDGGKKKVSLQCLVLRNIQTSTTHDIIVS